MPATIPFGTSLADFNGDGLLDVLCFDGTATNFLATLYRNTTGVSFSRIPSIWPGNTRGATHSFWADDNGDGLLDLIMSGEDDFRQQVIRIYWQNADHSFTEHPVDLLGDLSGWRDLDNDGRVDVISGVVVNWKEADGSYSPTNVSSSFAISEAADLDGDGDLDLLTASGAIFRNDGNRNFVNSGVRLFVPIAVADMDADGRLDVISNQPDIINNRQTFSDRLPVIFRNEGSLNFRSNAVPTGAHYYKAGAVGDLTADGKVDFLIIATQFGPGFPPVVFVNTNGGFLKNSFTFSINGGGAAAVKLADFDGDGDLDVLGMENEGRRRLFKNVSTLNHSVAPPGNLRSQPNRDRVNLFWDADPSKGATSYNIRIGTAPGLNDVVSAESTAAGRRLLPRMGNAQSGLSWQISKLKPGVYYWTVQAVDWTFRGSPFAEEQTFTITQPGPLPPPPTISSIPNAFTDEDTPVEVAFTVGPEQMLADLAFTIESSVPSLTPAPNLQLSGDGTNRTLRILPGPNQNGIGALTVRVTDSAGQQASASFFVSVFPVNDLPALTEFSNQAVYNNSGPLTIPYYAEDLESTFSLPFRSLKITATSSDTNFLPNSSIAFKSDFRGESTNIVITPPTNKVGSVTINVTLDDGQAQITSSFVLLILPPQFQDSGQLLSPNPAGEILWADFNNDGRLDLLVDIGGTPQMFRNNTNGFDPGFFTFPANALGSVAVADLNRDNYLDVLMVSPSAVRVFLNQNGTNFANAPGGAIPRMQFPTFDFADVDNDGDFDFFLSGQNPAGAYARQLIVNDAGGFRIETAPLLNIAGPMALADFDSDGWVDIVFAGYPSAGPATNGLYRGVGAGRFQFVNGSAAYVPESFSDMLDVNADGQPDLVNGSSRTLATYINDHGQFRPTTTNQFEFALSIRAWGDFTGDGFPDLLGIGTLPGITYVNALFENRRDQGFGARFNLVPGSLVPISVGDLNNDGTLDLIAAQRPDLRNPRIYTNASRTLNAPPGPPRNLQATVSSNGMVLSWNAPDDLNQVSGFTYNVRVGTRPEGSDVISASSLSSGKRLVVGTGNAGGRASMIVTNLTSDGYYWSVQAIDNSFAGGPFAPEESVRVILPGNLPPTVSADPASYIGGEDTVSYISLTLNDDRTTPENLQLRVIALDPALIPFTNFSITGTGATRIVKFRPSTNAFGATQLAIQTTDAGGQVGITLVPLTITNINDPPKISALSNQFSNGPGDPVTIPFSISDIDDGPDTLNLSATSGDLAVLPLQNISFAGSGTNRAITLFTESPAPATVSLAISVADPSGASANSTFSIAFTNRVFKLADASFPGVRSGHVAWGDFDGDHDLDFVLSGDGIINMSLYVNDGVGAFTKSPILLPAPDAPHWLDIDRDGDIDFLTGGGAIFYRNIGDGILERLAMGIPSGGGVVFGDFDNDGDLDLVKSANTATDIPRSYFLENTRAGFVQRDNIFRLSDSFPINFEDYNLDGWLDLRVARLGATWTNAIYMQRSNTFQLSQAPWPGELLLWADFDNDALPDAIVNTAPAFGSNGIGLFRNQGSGFGDTGFTLIQPFFPTDISAADYDNDGFLDVFLNGSPNVGSGIYLTKLFHNERNGTFREVQHPFPNFDFASVSWADVDNDGDLDALFTGQRPTGGYLTSLFKNNQSIANHPPSAPSGLRARYLSGGLLVEWDPGADANQSGGHTYNVAVGSQPGNWDALAPMSWSDGGRQIVAKGNAGWARSKFVGGLTPGQPYYFTVQAIDNSFAASPFAPIQSLFATDLPQLNAPVLIDGMLQFTLMAQPGRFYILESSTDLVTWNDVIAIDRTPIQFQVPLPGSEMRFFRIR